MAGLGSGYDISVSTFSPDGRVFQVEYASKAVDGAPLCLAAACKDGVVFAAEVPRVSPLLTKGANKVIFQVNEEIGLVFGGLLSDGRRLWGRARAEAANYKSAFGVSIPLGVLAERLSLFVHSFTLYWHLRPFGVTCLLGGLQPNPKSGFQELTGEIYAIDPSGCCCRFFAAAAGRERPAAKTELEKLNLKAAAAAAAAADLVRLLLQLGEDSQKDTKKEIQVAAITSQNGKVNFHFWQQQQVAAAVAAAQQAIQAMDSD
ncbi:proteasome subunit alpha type 3, putative [Eimeria tenella]|uniref:Proteasome subunit alpha type n=1 Tax=Eimeria tenella TaxID=5802 RepID=U6KHD6_EIMTE|nr:proteasome subunit alpha type 3, putative [Eimeria tenella]CDJ37430.1 proteasome subunit alpha type 3, putative [Eimeria tenella]|eukprot:XP_013228268.1 proteasome subunit alpha type 3, putative [Eimeria tenella]